MNKKLLIIGVFICSVFYACKKDETNGASKIKPGNITLSEARDFFERQTLPGSKLSMEINNSAKKLSRREILSDEKINDLLYKVPLWNQAYAKKVNNGTALAIPIHFMIKSYIRTGKTQGVDFDKLNYLLITKTPEGNFTAEWVTLYPDLQWIKGNHQSYTGRIVTADWDGNIKQSFIIDKSGVIAMSQPKRTSQAMAFSGIEPPFKNLVTVESYKTIDGKCYENIREVPDATGVTLYRREVDCPDKTNPKPSEPGFGSVGPGGGGDGNRNPGENYVPSNCNPDPNYKVPTTPPPPGKEYILPCQSPSPSIEEPIVQPAEFYKAPIVISLSDRLRYPALAKVADGLYEKAINDPKLMESLMKFSNMTKEQILYVLTPGQGPELRVVYNLGDSVYGEYKDAVISINNKYADLLNSFNMDTSKASMFDFFLTSTILHEVVHFGNDFTNVYIPNVGWFDAGAQFENAQYGGDVSYDKNTGSLKFTKIP